MQSSDPYGVPVHHMHPITREDLNWSVVGYTHSRCPGKLKG